MLSPLTPFSPLLRLRHEWFEFFGGVLLTGDKTKCIKEEQLQKDR